MKFSAAFAVAAAASSAFYAAFQQPERPQLRIEMDNASKALDGMAVGQVIAYKEHPGEFGIILATYPEYPGEFRADMHGMGSWPEVTPAVLPNTFRRRAVQARTRRLVRLYSDPKLKNNCRNWDKVRNWSNTLSGMASVA